MATLDPRVDAYIAKAAPFAQPILRQLRKTVHAACPEVVETIKWSMPFFDYEGPLCHMAAFKAHCAFGFWMGKAVVDETSGASGEAMGQLGRLTALADLPPEKTLKAWVKKAMALKASGVKLQRAPRQARPLVVPKVLAAALRENDQALATFKAFPPSKQREYAEWISEAKTDATRERRLAQAIDLLADGKSRYWKY